MVRTRVCGAYNALIMPSTWGIHSPSPKKRGDDANEFLMNSVLLTLRPNVCTDCKYTTCGRCEGGILLV